MRGIIATKPETMGQLTNLWLEKHLANGQFLILMKENLRGVANALNALTPVEHVLLVFREVTNAEHTVSDVPFLIEHYLANSAKCFPAQVTYVNNMMCHQLTAFAKHVFEHVFPAMSKTYVDTQIAFLLNVGGADALGRRMIRENPHADADWS